MTFKDPYTDHDVKNIGTKSIFNFAKRMAPQQVGGGQFVTHDYTQGSQQVNINPAADVGIQDFTKDLNTATDNYRKGMLQQTTRTNDLYKQSLAQQQTSQQWNRGMSIVNGLFNIGMGLKGLKQADKQLSIMQQQQDDAHKANEFNLGKMKAYGKLNFGKVKAA